MRRSRVRLLVLVVILAGVGAYRLRGVGRVDAIALEQDASGPRLRIAIIAGPRPSQDFFWRSDNIAFARRGIVAHTLSSFSVIQIDDPDGNELLFPTSE